MPDRVYIEGVTEGGFTKKLAWIDFNDHHHNRLHSCDEDSEAIIINYQGNAVEIDVTELPKELKIIRIQLS